MDKNVQFNNHFVFYTVSGEGPAVMLIHGVPADGSIWEKQATALNGSYRLIIPDLPGSGRSELTEDVSMEAMADLMKLILEEEKVTRVIVIGHSMGGYVSLALAEKYPEKIRALGLFHSSAYRDSEEKKASRNKNIDFIETHGSYAFIKQSTPGLFSDESKKDNGDGIDAMIEKYRNFNKDALIEYQKAMMKRSDRTALLETLTKPVLFIIGKQDKAVPFEDSMKQCHIPALSYIHILQNSGHMGMLEEADKCNGILENFLKDCI